MGTRRSAHARWLELAALALVSVLMLPMWFDWLDALQGWYASPARSQGAIAAGPGEDYLTSILWPPFALLWFATRATERCVEAAVVDHDIRA